MATFSERFGVMIPPPEDPASRERLMKALRFRSSEPYWPDLTKAGKEFVQPPEANWEITREGGDQPAGTTLQPPPEIASARNEVLPTDVNRAGKGDLGKLYEPGATEPPPKAGTAMAAEPAWLTASRKAEEAERAKPQIGQLEAAVRGFEQGGSFGWMDEYKGLQAASGLPGMGRLNPVVGPMVDLGRAAVGGVRKLLGNKDATEAYDKEVGNERLRGNTAREQHPVTSTVSELVGGAAVPLPGGVGTTLGRTALRQGAYGVGTGALQSLGESEDKSLGSAAVGGAIGGTLGSTLPYAGRLLSMVAANPINFVRNALNTQKAGERAVGSAYQEAERVGQRAQAAGRAGEERATLGQLRDPANETVVMDVLGTPGHDLGRSASNISPQSHGMFKEQLGERSRGRQGRNEAFINEQAQYPNPRAQREAIETAASAANDPNYKRVMTLGDFDLAAGNTGAQGLTRLAERSPAVQRAMREAEGALQDLHAGSGEQWHGVRNLEYWDQVKRQLDQQIGAAEHRGLNTDAMRLGKIRDAIVQRLDMQVPEYQTTRSVAASFFGQKDALQAGQSFFGGKHRTADALHAFNQMGDTEKQLFRDGLMDRVRTEARTDQNFWNKFARNANDIQSKLRGVLPPAQFNEMEARGIMERAMQSSSNAIAGNSSTARQLTQLGLATAAGAGIGHGASDETNALDISKGAGAGALYGLAKRGIDRKVADRITQILLSKDPAVLDRAAKAFARNEPYMNALRRIQDQLSQSTKREISSTPSRGEQR